jgi:hypothetical protein
MINHLVFAKIDLQLETTNSYYLSSIHLQTNSRFRFVFLISTLTKVIEGRSARSQDKLLC